MKLPRRDFVASLENGLAVIESFDGQHPRLTLSEVAQRTSLTRAAARRYLLTLAKLGYADYDGKHFGLDMRVLRLGYGHLASAPLPRKAQPVIDTVGWKTDEITSIAVLDENAVVFVARSQSRRLFSPTVGVGSRLPAWCSSAGRVLLAQREESDLLLMLGHTPLHPYTVHTKTQPRQIVDAVRAARADGYAVSDEEFEIGLRSIAVPVPKPNGRAEVALTVSVQAGRMSVAQMLDKLLPAMREGANSLATLL
ncbi:MAG TPA: IclR family transcriptional regulator C-terminal domain-containing protein [Burkholderiaceae bacterium]|jgi:IclR family pca regulon transcriptional regulator